MQIEHYNDANITLTEAFVTQNEGEDKYINNVEVTVYPSWVKIHEGNNERIISSNAVLSIVPTEENDQRVN